MSRLDERLRVSPIREGWIARTHFIDACASAWIDGELVHIEDLVLHDARVNIRSPTHELTRTHAVLRARRRIFLEPPQWALSPAGLNTLIGRAAVSEPEGDAARFVQNCTLSGFEFEQSANIAQRPEGFEGVGGGPDVIAGQGDVLPAEGRNVGEKAVGNVDASGAQMLDSKIEIHGVPVNDRGRHKGQARRPKALVLESPVTEFALPMKKESSAQGGARLAFVEARMAALTQTGIGKPFSG